MYNKDSDNYKPIPCDLHSQYELAIMHKDKLELIYKVNDLITQKHVFLPIDVQTKNKAEYLLVLDKENKNHSIRLDHILEMRILNNHD